MSFSSVVIQTKPDIQLHKFPKDANLKRQWVKFVQVKRADFLEPSEDSVVCSSHFSLDCYEKSYMVEMGLKTAKTTSSWCCTDDSGTARSKFFRSKKKTHTVGRQR